MAICSMKRILQHAEKNRYAVGYFEAWDLYSILGVIDAAEEMQSPVIIGFNGGFLGNKQRRKPENIYHYGSLGKAICEQAEVPAALILNEATDVNLLIKGLKAGFSVIMHDHESCTPEESLEINKYLVRVAHSQDAEVEAELGRLPSADVSNNSVSPGEETDPEEARDFVMQTGVDALAIAVGNVHMLEGGNKSSLNLGLIDRIRGKVSVPLVLHGGTGIEESVLKEAIARGITKINVGTVLRRIYIDTLKEYFQKEDVDKIDPNEVTSTGGGRDMMTQARGNIREEVCRFMDVFGSSGRAGDIH